jgi:hypothetical protein
VLRKFSAAPPVRRAWEFDRTKTLEVPCALQLRADVTGRVERNDVPHGLQLEGRADARVEVATFWNDAEKHTAHGKLTS